MKVILLRAVSAVCHACGFVPAFFRSVIRSVERASLFMRVTIVRSIRETWIEANARLTCQTSTPLFKRLSPMSHPMRGAVSINTSVLWTVIVAFVMIVFLITYAWNTGLPAIIGATSNTTALVAAGATTEQLNWITMAGGLLFIVLILGILQYVFNIFGGGSGGGGRATRFSRYRRRRRR